MILRKCLTCKKYTLKSECKNCKSKTIDPSYKFTKIRNAPSRSSPFKRK